jgi:hypothetical protein
MLPLATSRILPFSVDCWKVEGAIRIIEQEFREPDFLKSE